MKENHPIYKKNDNNIKDNNLREWNETDDMVTLMIPCKEKPMKVSLTHQGGCIELKEGIIFEEKWYSGIDLDDSTWTFCDDVVSFELTKVKNEKWRQCIVNGFKVEETISSDNIKKLTNKIGEQKIDGIGKGESTFQW